MAQLADIVTFKRGRNTVPWEEFNALLHQAIQATNSNQTQVMQTAGYSDSVISAWRKANAAPLCAKYTILGLLAELRVKVEQRVVKQFSYDDLLVLLSALAKDREQNRGLIATVAKEIASYD